VLEIASSAAGNRERPGRSLGADGDWAASGELRVRELRNKLRALEGERFDVVFCTAARARGGAPLVPRRHRVLVLARERGTCRARWAKRVSRCWRRRRSAAAAAALLDAVLTLPSAEAAPAGASGTWQRCEGAAARRQGGRWWCPARNEAGNIRRILDEMPKMGTGVEVLFVEGGSTDDTWRRSRREHAATGGTRAFRGACAASEGQEDATFLGFDEASGDYLDDPRADVTVPPADLPRFYERSAGGRRADQRHAASCTRREPGGCSCQLLGGPTRFSRSVLVPAGSGGDGHAVRQKVCRGATGSSFASCQRAEAGRADPLTAIRPALRERARLQLKILEMPNSLQARYVGESKSILGACGGAAQDVALGLQAAQGHLTFVNETSAHKMKFEAALETRGARRSGARGFARVDRVLSTAAVRGDGGRRLSSYQRGAGSSRSAARVDVCAAPAATTTGRAGGVRKLYDDAPARRPSSHLARGSEASARTSRGPDSS